MTGSDKRKIEVTEIKSGDQQPNDAKNESKVEQRALFKPSGRPSDVWPPVNESARINNIISTGNWTYLCSEALTHCESAQALTCTIDHTRFARGVHNVVFEVAFSNSTYWLVRIRILDGPDVDTEMLSEIATVRLVQQRTSLPIPTIFAYNCDIGNPFGFRYMFMSVLPGRILDEPFSESIPAHLKNKVASQLAKYLHELSRITFDKIGRIWCGNRLDEDPRIISFLANGERNGQHDVCIVGPFDTSRSHFRALRQGLNKVARVGHSDDEDWFRWATVCQIFTNAIPSLIIDKYEHGPFPLYHPDFHFNNILLDDEFNITGILDWSAAHTAPVEQFLVSPEFLTAPLLSEEENQPTVEFREMLIKAWREIETSPSPTSILEISDIASWTIPELVYRCILKFLALPRHAEFYAERVQHLLHNNTSSMNSNAENSPCASNLPDSGISGKVPSPIMGQALRRSNRKAPEKPRPVASDFLGPSNASKVSKAARLRPQRRRNISKPVTIGVSQHSSGVDVALQQPLPVPKKSAGKPS